MDDGSSELNEFDKVSKDFIHKAPKTIEFISNPDVIKLLLSNERYPIVALLRHGNFTVKEIVELYPTYAGSSSKLKSEKTIYRYLRELKSTGVIDEVGQRVTQGQTATEKIWGRTAKVFFIQNSEENDVDSFCGPDCLACKDDGLHQQSLKGIGLLTLLKLVPIEQNVEVNFAKFMTDLETQIQNTFKEQLKTLTNEDLNNVSKLSYTAINSVLLMSGLIKLLKNDPNFVESLLKKHSYHQASTK